MNEQQTKYIPHIGKKLRGHIDLNPLIELGMQVEEKPRYALVRIVKPSRSPAIRVDYDFFKQFEEEYLFKALRDFILELIDAQGRYEGDYTVLRGSEEHRTKAFPENNPAVSIYFSLHDIKDGLARVGFYDEDPHKSKEISGQVLETGRIGTGWSVIRDELLAKYRSQDEIP